MDCQQENIRQLQDDVFIKDIDDEMSHSSFLESKEVISQSSQDEYYGHSDNLNQMLDQMRFNDTNFNQFLDPDLKDEKQSQKDIQHSNDSLLSFEYNSQKKDVSETEKHSVHSKQDNKQINQLNRQNSNDQSNSHFRMNNQCIHMNESSQSETNVQESNLKMNFINLSKKDSNNEKVSSIECSSDEFDEDQKLKYQKAMQSRGNTRRQSLFFQDDNEIIVIQYPFLVIPPDSQNKKIWDYVIYGLLFYTAVFTPYRISFMEDSENTSLEIVDYFTDMLFIVDIFINFLTAYEADDGEIVYHKKMIAKNYLKGWFWIDFVSSFPIQFIFMFFKNTNFNKYTSFNNLIKISKLSKISRLTKLKKLMRVKKITKISPFEFKLEKLMNQMNLKQVGRTYIKFIFLIFSLVHISGCFWHMISKFDQDSQKYQWINYYNYQDLSTGEKYQGSVYFVLTILLTIGYGNIVPNTLYEIMFSIIFMFIGVLVFGYTLAYLTNLQQQINDKKNQITMRNELYNQIFMIFNFPRNLLEKMIKTTIANSDEESDLLQEFNNQPLLNRLPKQIQANVCQHIFRDVIQQIDFLQDKPQIFLMKFLNYCSPVYLNKGDEVYQQAQPALDAYFILKGRVALLQYQKEEEKYIKFQVFVEGSYFGVGDILNKNKRNEYAIAEMFTKIWKIKRQDLLALMNEFPDFSDEIVRNENLRDKFKSDNNMSKQEENVVSKSSDADEKNEKSQKQKLSLKTVTRTQTLMNKKLKQSKSKIFLRQMVMVIRYSRFMRTKQAKKRRSSIKLVSCSTRQK